VNPVAFQQLERPETAKVKRWRLEQLLEAGYEPGTASFLARRVEIDLHAAIELARRGCPSETAVRILV
jgi:hypothetical protein